MRAEDYTGVHSYTKCVKCGRPIAITRQFHTDKGYGYETENARCRYIDKWGYARNYCIRCMEQKGN